MYFLRPVVIEPNKGVIYAHDRFPRRQYVGCEEFTPRFVVV
jgi:hypothetical protein